MASANRMKFTTTAPGSLAMYPSTSESLLARLARHIPPAWWRPLLVISDTLLILLAFAGAWYLRYSLQWFISVDPANQNPIHIYFPFAALLLLILLVSYRLSGVYPYQPGRGVPEETYLIGMATTTGVMVLLVVSVALGGISYSRLIFLYTAILVTIFLGLSRLLIQALRSHLRRYGIGVKRVLLVGMGDVGRMVMRTITARPTLGYQLVGFLDDRPGKSYTDIGPFRALGPIENFEQVIQECRQNQHPIDNVIICLPWQSHRLVQRLLHDCEQLDCHPQVVPDFFQSTKNQIQVEVLDGIPLISSREVSLQGWNLAIKRIMDWVLIICGSPLIVPACLLIALAIRLDSPGPIIYTQTRIGKNGKVFRCHKFRSMVNNADALRQEIATLNESTGPLFKVRNDPRQTRVGRFLRAFSLDELPQLLNVLRGEMSIIGPRPNLPGEVEQYEEWHKKRLLVMPGLTGLWQVSGRSDLTFDEMVLLDIYYVENWSLALDLSIFLRSIPAVLWGKGAY